MFRINNYSISFTNTERVREREEERERGREREIERESERRTDRENKMMVINKFKLTYL